MINRIIVFLLVIFSSAALYSQSQGNNESLFRRLYLYNGQLTSETNIQPDGYTCLYVGDDKRVRTVVVDYSYPDSKMYIWASYSNSGLLESIKFSIKEPEGYSVWGCCVCKSGLSDSIYYDYAIQSMDDYSIRHVQLHTKDRVDIPNLDIKNFSSQKELLKVLNVGQIESLDKAQRVYFGKPVKDELTYINSNGVHIKQGNSTNSKTLLKVDVGTPVIVLRMLNDRDGDDALYEIKFKDYYLEGYNKQSLFVNGKFIEPVGRIVEK